MAPKVVPRGQVPVPPELIEQIKAVYNAKGGISGFAKRSGIKSDTLRLALQRGTTTERTLVRVRRAVERAGVSSLMSNGRAEAVAAVTAALPAIVATKGTAQPSLAHLGHLPPSVLRQVQRVSGALLDGMQLMQLTILKVLQEELTEGPVLPPEPPSRSRTR